MKAAVAVLVCAGMMCVPNAGALQINTGQEFLAGNLVRSEIDPALSGASAAEAPDSRDYAEGSKAIRENRWSDAIKIFDKVAAQGSEHAAGALYWKAYAQNKRGQTNQALDTCGALRQRFAGSSWIEDCGALEILVRASKGQVVQPPPGASDQLKLLALATLMQHDPQKATAQIEDILKGDSSEQLREGALFILGRAVPDASYPQIVRIRYLEGDVRIARGEVNEKASRETWEAAVMNLPLSTGDSVVTGKDGRAEIEFENASTVYLGPDSVLACDDLHSTDGVPHTEIGLLSGTLTTHLDSLKPGETFVLKTPTNDLLTRYPQRANLRISSYLDGMALTSLAGGTLNLPGARKESLTEGKTLFFDKDHHLAPWDSARGGDFTEFDAWVADRYLARKTAMAEEMKLAGLTTPIPGIADMKGQGRFFPCEPYGTCWEPDEGSRNPMLVTGAAPAGSPKTATAAAVNRRVSPNSFDGFPCLHGALLNYYPRNTLIAIQSMPGLGFENLFNPYTWAVCHAGWWIEYDHHYCWVAGHRLHHQPPVHWIKFGKTEAFVPVHPRDVKGQPPVNRSHGFVPLKEKGGYTVSRVPLDPGQRFELMKSPPREFRSPAPPVLQHVEAPHMLAYSMRQSPGPQGLRPNVTTPIGVPIRFDHQTQSFSAARQVIQGGRPATVYAPVGNIGGSSVAARSPAFGEGGGVRVGGNASTASGAGFHAGASGGAVPVSSSISVSSTNATSAASPSAGAAHK